jgi:hypothetical protein
MKPLYVFLGLSQENPVKHISARKLFQINSVETNEIQIFPPIHFFLSRTVLEIIKQESLHYAYISCSLYRPFQKSSMTSRTHVKIIEVSFSRLYLNTLIYSSTCTKMCT